MKFQLGAIAVSIALAVPAIAQEEITASTVVATVNGTDITAGHMIHLRSSLPAQYQTLPDEMLFQGILDQLIDQTLLGSEIEESLAIRLAVENERRALLAADAIDALFAGELTQTRIEAIYMDEYVYADPQQEYNASHILVPELEEAEAIKADLDGGADFAEMAKEKSTGPSGPNGGELGWFALGVMVPEFEDAIVTLEVGDISDPVQTQFGWHLIRMNDIRDLAPPSLAEVQDQIVGQIQQELIDQRVEELRMEAEVVLNEGFAPSLIREVELLDAAE